MTCNQAQAGAYEVGSGGSGLHGTTPTVTDGWVNSHAIFGPHAPVLVACQVAKVRMQLGASAAVVRTYPGTPELEPQA